MQRTHLSGLDAVNAVTSLLQQSEAMRPQGCLYQAAELQFWWSRPRPTDDIEQIFWFDDGGSPVAAALLFDFSGASSILYESVTFCPFTRPDATPETVAQVVADGLAHAADLGFATVEIEVSHGDDVLQGLLRDRGFEMSFPEMLVECWMPSANRPAVSPLAEGYRAAARADVSHLPHHLARTDDDPIVERLAQLSLYRADLDMVALTADDEPAANALCWYDPTTNTGVVEPVRTQDAHQRKGLSRHLLTTGVNRLFELGVERISIGYEPENPASGHLYRSVGFEPTGGSDLWAGPTN